VLSTIVACWRGFVKELFTILGLLAASFAAFKGEKLVEPYFKEWIGVRKDGGEAAAQAVTRGAKPDAGAVDVINALHSKGDLILGIIKPSLLAQACSYGAIFVAVFLVMALLSYFITRSIQESGLTIVDRIIGASFGLVRGFLLIFLPYVAIFVLTGKDMSKFPDWARNSVSVPILASSYDTINKRLDVDKVIKTYGDKVIFQLDQKAEKKADEASEELKDELSREEKERQPPSP
jgi:uncharacterized membrane protein required for colicin V production